MTDIEIEQAAQAAAEARLAHCQATLYEEEDGELPEAVEDQVPVAPFCGCDTCIVREVLDAAWPHMIELARREVARV